MAKRKVSFLQGTDAVRYKLPAEDNRLNTAAAWTPAAAGLQVRSGIAAGPGAPGAVTAVTGGVSIAPATVLVQGTVTTVQGVYACTWDAAEFRAAPAASASQYRRILVVVRVYDQANNAAKDDWDLEVVLGVGAASLAAAVAPTVPDNSFVLRAGSVDPSGVVTLTGASTFTVGRGGILPVDAADTLPGAYLGQYRDHPTRGLQRWTGSVWGNPAGDTGWVNTPVPVGILGVGAGGSVYRVKAGWCALRSHFTVAGTAAVGNGQGFIPLPAEAWPTFGLSGPLAIGYGGTGNGMAFETVIGTTGVVTINGRGLTVDGYQLYASWPVG